MKSLFPITLLAAAALTGCGSAANTTTNNANLRGANTNTGYVTNTDANVKPTIPANATNLTPGNVTNGNHNTNSNSNVNRK